MLKRVCSLLLALVILICLSSAVFASTAHAYTAYQIFTAAETANNGQDLVGINWGAGVNGANLLAALKSSDAFGGAFEKCGTAYNVASVLNDWGDTEPEKTNAFARLAYANKATASTGTVTKGYYLVIDNPTGEPIDFYNVHMLKVLEDGKLPSFAAKTSVPVVQKWVKEKNDSTGAVSEWQKAADYDIGDAVPFRLEAKLGDLFGYDRYYLCFHDTLSKGLSFDTKTGTFCAYVDGVDCTKFFRALDEGTDAGTGEHKLAFWCADVLDCGAKKDSVIAVEFNATLNENAKIGAAGNPNEVYLEYSNNPNEVWDGTAPFTPEGETPNLPSTGDTPKHLAIVFTYQIVVNKKDENEQPLTGATFSLKKLNAETKNYELVALSEKTSDPVFTWYGVDAGDYLLTEESAPETYYPIEPIYFRVESTLDNDATVEKTDRLTALVVKLKDEEGAYVADEDGQFKADTQTGVCATDVINMRFLTLPRTGGKGAKLFYAIGGLMILGGVVLLSARKRIGEP